MILKALYDYYQTLATDPKSGVSKPGYSREQVGFALVIDKKGNLKDLLDLRNEARNRLMNVPQHNPPRTGNVLPYLLADNSKYFLGVGPDKGKQKLILEKEKFEAAKTLHLNLLKDVADETAKAIIKYFQGFQPEKFLKSNIAKENKENILKSSNLIFILQGGKKFAQDIEKIKSVIKISKVGGLEEDGGDIPALGQCAVIGGATKIPATHGKIKGVRGTKQSQGSMVSFNDEAYESYGKKQNINASIGQEAAFAYVTALNFMLQASSMQNVQIGDATTVFWAEKYGTGQEELIYAFFDPTVTEKNKIDEGAEDKKGKKKTKAKKEIKENTKAKLNDPNTISRMRDFLGRVASGKGLKDMRGYDPDVKFYVLGLSPNVARISVRFFYADTFGKIVERIKQHYADMLIEKQYKNESDAIAVWQLLKETAAQGKSENIQPAFSGGLMRAILMGGIYPVAVYQAIISRIGIDKKINRNRVAFVKAYLQRKARINKKEGGAIMSLNKEEKNVGYCLGRLFALLEKAQSDASPRINATIKDRYFGTASSSPKAVFPFLLRLGQHYIAGAEYGKSPNKRIGEVMDMVGSEFPAHLNLDDQGRFMLGYYHQKNSLYNLYKKKEEVKSDK